MGRVVSTQQLLESPASATLRMKGILGVWGLAWGEHCTKLGWGWHRKQAYVSARNPLPSAWSSEEKGLWDVCLQSPFPGCLWWKSPANLRGKSFCIWMGPSSAVPFSGSNFSSFSSQLHSPHFLKPERLQQSSGSLTSPRTSVRSLSRELGTCLAPGTPAEIVFAGDVSLELGSVSVKCISRHVTLDAPGRGSSQGLGFPESQLASHDLC